MKRRLDDELPHLYRFLFRLRHTLITSPQTDSLIYLSKDRHVDEIGNWMDKIDPTDTDVEEGNNEVKIKSKLLEDIALQKYLHDEKTASSLNNRVFNCHTCVREKPCIYIADVYDIYAPKVCPLDDNDPNWIESEQESHFWVKAVDELPDCLSLQYIGQVRYASERPRSVSEQYIVLPKGIIHKDIISWIPLKEQKEN